jgi:lipoate-protein ligase A
MFLINNNHITNPSINLALEEYCLRSLDSDKDYFLFYINAPTIVVGKHQNIFEEINWEYTQKMGIRLIRRISGGGAVYHDHGNLNFSFITGFKKQKLDYFKILMEPIVNTLRHLGVPAEIGAKNNIFAEGKKISGNSQYTNIKRMLSHGTLLFDTDIEMLTHALDSGLDIIESKGIPSKKSAVVNITEYLKRRMDINGFRHKIFEGLEQVFGEMDERELSEKNWDCVHQLAVERYQRWDWTYGHSPEFIVRYPLKSNSHKVNARIGVNRGLVKSIYPELGDEYDTIRSLIGKRYTPSLFNDEGQIESTL